MEYVNVLKEKLHQAKQHITKQNEKYIDMKKEKMHYESQLSHCNIEKSRLESAHKQQIIRLEHEITELHTKLTLERDKTDELKDAQKVLLKQVTEELTYSNERDDKTQHKMEQLKEEIANLETVIELKELEELEMDHTQLQMKLQKMIIRNENLEKKLTMSEQLITQLDHRLKLQKIDEQKLRVDLEKSQQQLRKLVPTPTTPDVHAFDALVMNVVESEKEKRELSDLRIEVSSLRKMKSEYLLLKEKYYFTKNELERCQKQLNEITDAQMTTLQLQQNYEELERALASTDLPTVGRVVQTITELRRSLLILEKEKSILQSDLRIAQDKANLALNSLSPSPTSTTSSTSTSTLFGSSDHSYELLKLSTELEVAYASRKELQSLIHDFFKGMFDVRDETVAAISERLSNLLVECNVVVEKKMDPMKREMTTLQNENEKLKNENRLLNESISQLRQRVATGEYNPQTTKVIHLSINPSSTTNTADLFEKLQDENVSGLEVSSVDEVTDVKMRILVRKMQTKYANQMSIIKRKMKCRISEMRSAVYWIFGWRLDMNDFDLNLRKRVFRLITRNGGQLDLEIGENGDVNMLETEFGREMMEIDTIRHCLVRKKSIPAYVSQITLHLLEKGEM
jgi:hypothetical protein